MNSDVDIAVVGGGLAGASLACALAGTGYTIALIEASSPDAPVDAAGAIRTTAIAWGTRTLFERLDLWPAMTDAAAPITGLHISQKGALGSVRVTAEEYGLPALGYVLPNTALTKALRSRLTGRADVRLIAPARFASLYHEHDRIALTLIRGGKMVTESLRARLVIGADGARSSVRSALGIGARVDDYRQSGVITLVVPERGHDGCAFERFTAGGPVALLPCAETRCAVVWTLPTAAAQRVCALADAAFHAALQAAFGHRLGRLTVAAPRGAYPLYRVLCNTPIACRAVLIGNAGHALHPAADQGFNLAIRDVLALAAMLRERAKMHDGAFDPGDADLLAAWAEARRPDQHRVANFTDAIVRLFSNRLPGFGAARAAGLVALSLAPTVRHDMARRSMGLALAPVFGAPHETRTDV